MGNEGAAGPFAAWLRARKRIRDLEMTLLAQASDTDHYEDLRRLLQQVVAQTVDPTRPVTPH